ncbi:uncharacterized protein EV154DRAFT_432601 [Mucor mucedo]|uniref:uncharacterized protein n=1 Tax=Mucor mucedo TaxID=29922 RepID=UPI002220C308|nr:uncharacterized protein EV154DRAFT_432601 [Mucor mucedo]KAI7866795.1 hypothetical protein EV154DRAFT_432601 [Mucor mucedo]
MTGAPLDVGLYGNPNDYVFSQNALDNIITQLMEQTGGASAPPPAPEQVIEALKKRSLTEKEKSSEADCAVCKDQFESHETVIELPCEHIFHDDCIKPWLKLNSTCPVCRHSVLPEQESANGQNSNNDSNNGTNDNHNTQNTQQTREANDGNNSTGSTASYTWVSGNGGGNGTAHQGMPTSFPVNLATAFPSWINNLTGNASRSNSTSTATNTNTTSTNTSTNTNTSTTTNSNENTNSNTATSNNATSNTNTHLDDDLDLD